MVLKVHLFNEPNTYWTFALEESLKVGTVLDQLYDKLSTRNLTLFCRTSNIVGMRTDKMLGPSDSLYDLSEKYKKKKKPYQLFVHAAAADARLFRVRSTERMSAPIARSAPLLNEMETGSPTNGRSRSSSTVSTPTKLSPSHSAPLYLEGNEPAKSPRAGAPRLIEKPPKEAQEVLLANNEMLQRTLSGRSVLDADRGTFGAQIEVTGSSFVKQGSYYGYMSTPPNNSVHVRLDLHGTIEEAQRKSKSGSGRHKITDIESSTPPTPANSLKPRDVAPIDHSSFFKNRSLDDMPSSDTSSTGSSYDHFYSLPSQNQSYNPALDTLTIIRVYASDNGDLEGPCWTLAVAARTRAREACSMIETQLGVPNNALRICMIDALSSNTSETKEERKITDDEKLLQVRDEWLKKGHIPFFFLREQTSSLAIQDVPRRPISSPDIRAKKHVYESDDEKRDSTAIFLGGSNVDSFDSPAEPPESPELSTDNPVTIDSSAWTMEHNIKGVDYGPRPHINWINSNELERVHKVGDGGYAKVYKSRYKDKFVAVKTLKGVATMEQMESFKKEFEVLSLTNSPYLIRFYGASINEADPSSPILSVVLEYCERGTMHKALNNKKLEIDWQTCFKWIHQTLNGILYLHNMTPQMVHRDIKTLNLLLDSKWNVKVADFGLSRSMSMTNKSSLGVMKGTLAYCAPEIHKGMLFTPKSDAYSMSIVMWELITRCITGRYYAPYSEYPDIYHDFQIIFLTATQNRRPTIPPKTPDVLKDLLQQCWEGDPDNRLTCDQILLQIQSIYVQYLTEKNEWESRRQVV